MINDIEVYFFTFFKILVGFCVIVVHLKLTNKSQTIQLTPIDFIGNFILGGIIGGVIYNPDISFLKYLIMLLSAIFLINGLNWISTKYMPARQMVMGSVIPIIINGKFQFDSFKKESENDHQFDLIDFMATLRTQGIFSLEEVEYAQLEANGGLTVIKKGQGYPNYLLAKSGQMLTTELARISKDEAWLNQQLATIAITLEDVYLVEFSNNNRLYIVQNDGTSLTIVV